MSLCHVRVFETDDDDDGGGGYDDDDEKNFNVGAVVEFLVAYRGLRARTHQLQIRLNAANRKTKFATRCKIS